MKSRTFHSQRKQRRMAPSGNKCFNCGGEGHFARECPSHRQQTRGGGVASSPAPTAWRFWTPRRPQEDSEEKDFLRQLIQEKREEQNRRKEFEDKRKMDELIRMEIERNSEAMEARVLSKIGRQYPVNHEEARWEELRSPAHRPAFTPIRERDDVDIDDRGIKDIEDEIAKLYEVRERQRRGKEVVQRPIRPFRQPLFQKEDVPVVNNPRPESSRMGEDRARSKIPTGSGPEGVLNYVLQQRLLLTGKNKNQFKAIYAIEGVQYTTKVPAIDRLIEERVKLPYEGFIFVPAPSTAASPEQEECTPCK
ncbi:hypothetical protein CBR_g53515 [Chara braunii]|uniref:CCHC-type domain-containing protein n=1 Tax=Chara braunii TaxID=69332 RepID=A0A388MAU4_CHABU|nr:hypothetical protein CBR_g53515 [Chara braunii]|eukprot:GBG91701.1 hypothetical protein CBR_g53515 [Chara braunii]